MRFTGLMVRLTLALVFVGTTVLAPGCASTKNVMNKATFGLVGNKDDGAKEQKRAEKKQKEAEKRAAKEEKKAQKKARKAEKRTAKAQSEDSERGFWNKATFGLVGDESNDKAATKEAKRQAEQEKKAQKQAAKQEKKAQEQAAKDEKKAQEQARNEQDQMAKAGEAGDSPERAEKSERGFWNKATFGLVGSDSKDKDAEQEAEQSKKAQKQTAKEEKQAQEQAAKKEKKAQKQAEKYEKEQKQMAKSESESPEAAEQTEQPKRGLMSKLTFGLVGGDAKGREEAETRTVEEEMPASTPEPPVAMPSGDDESDAQPATALTPEARKLAKLPFETSISYDSMSASGKQQAVASRATYSKHDYGITDLGDVRIAVRGMTFGGGTKGGRVIISSEDRAKAAGTAGIGNESFSFQYEKGSTNCSFGTIQFSIEQGVIAIGGRTVPMGKGHKLVILDEQGAVEGVYDID